MCVCVCVEMCICSCEYVSVSGEVYTWGDNDEGQLGDGSTNAIQRPRLVGALQGKKINRVACGSAHTLAWSTSKPTNAGKLPAQVLSMMLRPNSVFVFILVCTV